VGHAPIRLLPNIALALGQTAAAFLILLCFTIIAGMALLVIIEAYLVVGGAAILLAFGGSRFTASMAEGYFAYVIRVGVRLLFFYLVLGIGVRIATGWHADLTAACHPVTTTLPWYATYGVPPTSIITTICSSPLPGHLFIQQVMSGQTAVAAPRTSKAGRLPTPEIKAIASGNPGYQAD
jgi:P-type conjugative transfer protein TrbL